MISFWNQYSDAIADYFIYVGNLIWGIPFLLSLTAVAIFLTFYFDGITIFEWPISWHLLFKKKSNTVTAESITPVQAFLNALSSSLGNGSLAGMATAMYLGGPGAGFWILLLGIPLMSLRFAEVYASSLFTEKTSYGVERGGPMIYLSKLPGGIIWPKLYAFFCLLLALIGGNAMQCNAMALGLHATTQIPLLYIGLMLSLLLLYIVSGGAKRVIAISDALTPIKVGSFFIATIAVLVYHAPLIMQAIIDMAYAALTPKAFFGAATSYTLFSSMRYGLARSINASEAGLGTAAIMFGSTKNQKPICNALLSLTTVTITTYGVCFALMILLMVTGAYKQAPGDIRMTIVAYESLFGSFGSMLVTFLTTAFGVGCVVAYAYIGRECWNYLTHGSLQWLYALLFCAMALAGSLLDVPIIWNSIDIINGFLLSLNCIGLLYLAPAIRTNLRQGNGYRACL